MTQNDKVLDWDKKDDVRYEFIRKPRKCPACGSVRIADIMYGYPIFSEKLDEALKAEKIILGGCCVSDDDTKWSASIVMCPFISGEVHLAKIKEKIWIFDFG